MQVCGPLPATLEPAVTASGSGTGTDLGKPCPGSTPAAGTPPGTARPSPRPGANPSPSPRLSPSPVVRPSPSPKRNPSPNPVPSPSSGGNVTEREGGSSSSSGGGGGGDKYGAYKGGIVGAVFGGLLLGVAVGAGVMYWRQKRGMWGSSKRDEDHVMIFPGSQGGIPASPGSPGVTIVMDDR